MYVAQTQIRPKVLCIDDDPAIVAALGTRLRGFDVDVLTAFFGTQGIWLAVTERPNVIVTDIRMPSGNGDYAVECLKSRPDTCDIPVIVLSGQRDGRMKRKMLALGVQRYLCKPVSLEKVVEVIGRFVELHLVTSV